MPGVVSAEMRSSMDAVRKNFDPEAAVWDEDPGRVRVAADIARAVIAEAHLTSNTDVLDFGCGTGLISLALQPFVRSVTGMDSSRGMLDVFQNKIAATHIGNVKGVLLDPEMAGVLTGHYHLIVCSMTLHHIQTVEPLLRQFYQVLNPVGLLCIADLDSDGGRFHSSSEGVFHAGFGREDIRRMLLTAGFRDLHVMQASQIEKPVGDNRTEVFTVFLMTGRKSFA
jgi:2-polyprenyl-3-methyl-5-hydroxy-6-metoxy-1,4-benzoquinol methylase